MCDVPKLHLVFLNDEEKAATLDLFTIMIDNLLFVRKNGHIVSEVPQTMHIGAYVNQLVSIRKKIENT